MDAGWVTAVPDLRERDCPSDQRLGAIVTAAECRKLAKTYRDQVGDCGISQKRSSILRNVANTLAALGSQLEMLDEEERQPLGRKSPPPLP
ncbi:hypothetical protein ACVWZW_008469 [Bradyrhizobium sp. F1.13.4]